MTQSHLFSNALQEPARDVSSMPEILPEKDSGLPVPPGYAYPALHPCPVFMDGYAACPWIPATYWERFERQGIIVDRQGFGIPAQGLPDILKPFSLNGWVLKRLDGGLALHPGIKGGTNGGICRQFLCDNLDEIDAALALLGY